MSVVLLLPSCKMYLFKHNRRLVLLHAFNAYSLHRAVLKLNSYRFFNML